MRFFPFYYYYAWPIAKAIFFIPDQMFKIILKIILLPWGLSLRLIHTPGPGRIYSPRADWYDTYVWRKKTLNGIDCSGLTSYVLPGAGQKTDTKWSGKPIYRGEQEVQTRPR